MTTETGSPVFTIQRQRDEKWADVARHTDLEIAIDLAYAWADNDAEQTRWQVVGPCGTVMSRAGE